MSSITLWKVNGDGSRTKALSGKPKLWGQYLRYNYLQDVFNARLQLIENPENAQIVVTSSPQLQGKWETFSLVMQGKKLIISGSDARGKAYGILELSRMIGVSPWEWWADAVPAKKKSFKLPSDFHMKQSPAVAFRGIFINDEDWGILPWSNKTYEPSDIRGRIGPKTYSKIFELMLRLRANTIWPAMHEVTRPFYLTEGNREAAEKFGIYVGTSHCEPLVCNANGEWDVRGKGDYNYITNKDAVIDFWTERLKELKKSNNIFTVGMRGKHDGMMYGVKTLAEHKQTLDSIIADQRTLLKTFINEDITKVPQVFIPYKEVLEVYRDGLVIPDDVTLMWVDDNFGYVRYLPDREEQARSGGNGLYYHLSYWGRPHDYLWLSTTSPALVQTELERAYTNNVRKIWIMNVGDIKPSEYLLEYVMDMAWDESVLKNRNSNQHLSNWLEREFGKGKAKELLPLLNEYYHLSYECRPEFLGNSRVYDNARKAVRDLEWSDRQVEERLQRCIHLENRMVELSKSIDSAHYAHWYQLVEYPVRALCAMNRKMLNAQLARHGKALWNNAIKGYDNIVEMTRYYDAMLNGKWKYMMDFQPRKLDVFEPVDTTRKSSPIPDFDGKIVRLTSSDGSFGKDSYTINELGYSRKALCLSKGDDYSATIPASTDSLEITLAFVPNHPAGADQLQVEIRIGDAIPFLVDYHTDLSHTESNEEWKQNVLRNQALRTFKIAPSSAKRTIHVKAMTPAVILDEIVIRQVLHI